MYNGFQRHELDGEHGIFIGAVPKELELSSIAFEQLWVMHPPEHHEIHIHGRRVKTPRWQQAYGSDYHFSGQVYESEPTPPVLLPVLKWAQSAISEQLNGLLVNWYDGALGHYVGKHRDSVVNMIDGAPIVTVSFGEKRKFRLRPYQGKGFRDFSAEPGSVFVIPYATNLAWTHEVPASRKQTGRRISVTLRAFRT